MNSAGKAPVCVPTWRGHIETTKDALLIFEACFEGHLAHCFRRPHDRERNTLIVSGNVFVYEEATSGIKRWTDGIPWSPSRILTNFLIYRQLNSPFPPGEKKRATKRSQRPLKPGEPYPTSATSTPVTEESRPFPPESPNPSRAEENADKDANRGLVGSLVDSYEFKEHGLLKKTMTVTVNNVQHHLVSYYSLEDAKNNLRTPRDDLHLKELRIREALLNQPKFKFPNFDDAGDGTYEQLEGPANPYQNYGYQNGYDPRIYAGMQSPSVSAPMAFSPAVYAPSHPPSTSQGYTSVVPTTAGYAAPVQYPQHAPLNPQHYAPLNQMPQYQNHAQPQHGYQSQHYPAQSQDHRIQHPTYQSHGATNHVPRMDLAAGAQSEAALHQDQLEAMVPTSQAQQQPTWPMGYTGPAWAPRADTASYSSYRTQS